MKSARMFRVIIFLLWCFGIFPTSWAGALHEPERGVYLGVLMDEDATVYDGQKFLEESGKKHAVYARFLVFNQTEFPTNWLAMIQTINPRSGAHLILEPMNDFPGFFAADWGPGQASYDSALAFANNCRDAGLPIFLRFAHEPNGWWYPWCPSYSESDAVTDATYILGWRNFATLVHKTATNVAMVWAPNQGNGPGDVPLYTNTYPGDDVVDWVGMSIYNGEWYGNSNAVMNGQFRNGIQSGYWQNDGNPSNDTQVDFYWTFSDPNNPAGHHKPMMVAETASQFVPLYSVTSVSHVARFETLASNDVSGTVSDQNWWNDGQPWGTLTWQLTTDCAEGQYALRMNGTDADADGYLGGNGCSLDEGHRDWTTNGYNAVVLYAKRDAVGDQVSPEIQITFDNDFTENNGNEATVKYRIDNTNYTSIVIEYGDFYAGTTFDWTAIHVLKLELFTSRYGYTPASLFLDDLRQALTAVTNQADNLKWKTDWMFQLFSLQDSSAADTNHPAYTGIASAFPNLHMISWFQKKKFEDGFSKDFRIPAEGGRPVFTTYHGLIASNYFLTSIVPCFPQPIAAGDIDGDRLADPTIYDEVTGGWYVLLSADHYALLASLNLLGGPDWMPIPADYDGDGKADPAVYQPATGDWLVMLSSQQYVVLELRGFLGGLDWQAASADYDGDRLADPAVYCESSGTWRILPSASGYQALTLTNLLGGAEYLPASADYDGDGKADPMVYHPPSGTWIVRLSRNDYVYQTLTGFLGGSAYSPVPADYDGDRLADPAVCEAATGNWLVKLSAGGYVTTEYRHLFGNPYPQDQSTR